MNSQKNDTLSVTVSRNRATPVNLNRLLAFIFSWMEQGTAFLRLLNSDNMKLKSFTIIIISTLFIINIFGQKENINKVNQFNNKGQKTGLWVDSSGSFIIEKYYKNDILSGIYIEYYTTGKLSIFWEYKNGLRCGTWFYFDNNGYLIMLFKDFSKNNYSIINEGDGKKYIPDYKCYTITYYPNGNIQNEGTLLWSEGEAPESDFSVEYGEWKYYDENGKLIKTRNFK